MVNKYTDPRIRVGKGETGFVVLIRWGKEIVLYHYVGLIGQINNRKDYDKACSKALAKF